MKHKEIEMTPQEAANLIYERICGTSQDILMGIDYLIEDGEIDREFYGRNEQEILDIVDSMMFNCAVCGWAVDNCDMSLDASNMTDNVCVDCYKEEEDAG